jgi:hypothetical protein
MHPYRVLAWLLISAACGLAGCKETVIGETMTSRYRILSDSPHLRVLLEGETRRNPATNRLVLWDLVLVTPDQYCWHRADGKPGSCSRRIVRCQAN